MFRFLSTPKKVLTKISHPKKVTTKFQTQKKSSDRKFQTQKRASHIPVTYIPEYPPWGYKALKLYLQKVNPKCTAFFQYPKKNSTAEDAIWYEARPLGIHSLAKMMKDIRVEARLSKVYTNHCVRAAAITLWSNSWISNRQIMAISGQSPQ